MEGKELSVSEKIPDFDADSDLPPGIHHTSLEITRKKIVAIQKLLLEMKRTVPYRQYLEMSEAFLADIKRMEE